MGKLLDRVRAIFQRKVDQTGGVNRKRRDSQIVGHSSAKEIEAASPERAGELAGHAVERVDT
jgi:hypothetical protein